MRDSLGSKPTMRSCTAILVLSLVSCRGRSSAHLTTDTLLVFTAPPPAAPGAPILRISLTRDATVHTDGRPVTLATLDSALDVIKSKNGGVWLYQDVPEPRPRSTLDTLFKRVAEHIANHHLPVSFARKPDFSDLVAEHSPGER